MAESNRLCAICAEDRVGCTQQPLGRGNALVWVCPSCNNDAPVASHGPERGYEPSGSIGNLGRAVTKAAKRIQGSAYGKTKTAPPMRARDPNTVLVRVPTWTTSGARRRLDNRDAFEAARKLAPGKSLTLIGATRKWFLFSYPKPPKPAPPNPLEAIEQYRRKA